MLKVLILLALFAAVEPSLDQFYGQWTLVVVYENTPSPRRPPNCLVTNISKDPRNIECTCGDGWNATLFEFDMTETVPIAEKEYLPFIEISDVADVNTAVNLTCLCGEKHYKETLVGRTINKDYNVIYDRRTRNVVARKLETQQAVEDVLMNDEEFKHKRGYLACLQ